MSTKAKNETTDEEDEQFMRSLVFPEEDRAKYMPRVKWDGGYRWFRSPNVVCIERYQPQKSFPAKPVGS